MSAWSDYAENTLIDWFFRGQAFSPPSTMYVGLLTSAPSDSGSGTEVTGNNYARVSFASSFTNWAGTQGAGTTGGSTGTSGTTSNNVAVVFTTPSASWGLVTHFGIYDAPSGGNLLIYGALAVSKTINANDTVSFPAGSLSFQIDN